MNNPLCPFCNSICSEYYRNDFATSYECLNCNVTIPIDPDCNIIKYCLFSKESYEYVTSNNLSPGFTNSKIFKNSIPKYLIMSYFSNFDLYSFDLKLNNYSLIDMENKNVLSIITPNNFFEDKIKTILIFM